MAVPSGYAPLAYAGNDVAYTFAFTWPLLAAAHLVVIHTDALGVETTLVNGTNYDLTWIGIGATGSIRRFQYSGATKVDYPLAIGETLTLSRAVPVEQPTDLRRGGKLSPEILERAYDRACMIAQQTEWELDTHADSHLPGGSRAIDWQRILGRGSLMDRPEPGATYADCYYLVESDGILYQCNHAGTAWLIVFDPSSILPIVDGGPIVAAAPANTVAPAVTGSTTLGATLSCSTGTWSGLVEDYAYQWQRNGADIVGSVGTTYVIAAADDGTTLRCVVTATNDFGSTDANSNGVAISLAPDYFPSLDFSDGRNGGYVAAIAA
jgi:hypothetical protein